MAGTRLAIHATFVVELLILVAASLLYATTRRHDPYSSAEPFLPDRSGWRLLAEHVSPAPVPDEEGGIVAQIGELAGEMVARLDALLGAEVEKRQPHRPRRTSAFVQEMRRKVAQIPAVMLPPLTVELVAPQVDSPYIRLSLAAALEKGFGTESKESNIPDVRLGVTDAAEITNGASCDEFQLPTLAKSSSGGNRREVKHPEIVLLMGCSRATVPDGLSSVEVDHSSGTAVVRTVLTADHMDKLSSHLEKQVSSILSSTFFVPLSSTGQTFRSISIELTDEDPGSHSTEGAHDFNAKGRFDMLGEAMSSASQSMMAPIVEDLSFLYGGNVQIDDDAKSMTPGSTIESKGAIDLKVGSSAYLPLPDDIIEKEILDDGTVSSTYVTSDDLANWIHAHSHQRNNPDEIEWLLFIPALLNAPLTVREESTGEEGESIILTPPALDRGRIATHPSGVSVVNIPSGDNSYQGYEEMISRSLAYAVGYIRAIHGLPPSVDPSAAESGKALSFWELDSISRGNYFSTLEGVLSETDALMALLHQHGGTVALPVEVAHRLNNATNLLRQSISLVEEGYPAMYATSLLHGALRCIESVQGSWSFMELPYFAPDHYLAVFSPLVLPLLLPMIAGLIREIKRFRELTRKRDNST